MSSFQNIFLRYGYFFPKKLFSQQAITFISNYFTPYWANFIAILYLLQNLTPSTNNFLTYICIFCTGFFTTLAQIYFKEFGSMSLKGKEEEKSKNNCIFFGLSVYKNYIFNEMFIIDLCHLFNHVFLVPSSPTFGSTTFASLSSPLLPQARFQEFSKGGKICRNTNFSRKGKEIVCEAMEKIAREAHHKNLPPP